MRRVCLVTNIIPPYRDTLFQEIAGSCDLTVYISAPSEANRAWEPWREGMDRPYRTIILKGRGIPMGEGVLYLQPDLVRHLGRGEFDTIINSSFGPNTLLGALHARLRGRKAILWSEATPHSERDISFLRRIYRIAVLRLHDGCIASGTEAMHYLASLGADPRKCFLAVDAAPGNPADETEMVPRIRSVRELFPDPIILYVGRLVRKKGLAQLISAFGEVVRLRKASLLIMGSGPLERELRMMVDSEGIPGIAFLGYKEGPEKWACYEAADLVVLPSECDVWGMVVNEAMLAGKPVVCSKFAGAAADLVHDGFNGFVVDPYNVPQVARRILEILEDPDRRVEMGRRSREIISDHSIRNAAGGFLMAIESVGKA